MDDNRRNFILFFNGSILFTNAMTFLSINAVITYFLAELGASTFEIGLANALVSIGAVLSTPIFAKIVMNLSYKVKPFTRILLTQRVFFLVFVMCIPLFAESQPRLMVILFLICWSIFSLFIGSYSPFYMSLFAKMIAVHRRGRLRGYSGGTANLIALGTAFLTGVLLKEIPFPYNYTIIFAMGVLLLIAEAYNYSLMREQPDQVTPVEMKYIEYYKSIPVMFRENPAFLRLVVGFSFLMISQVSLAYYALYAVRSFDINGQQVALFTAVTGFVNVIGNIVFGILADKFGHRVVVLLSAMFGAAAGFLAFGVPQLWAVYVAFGLTNLCMSAFYLSSGILIIDLVSKEKLPMYISMNSMLTLMVSSLVTVGSSFLVDAISFGAVFVIAGFAGVFGGIVLYRYQSTSSNFKKGRAVGGNQSLSNSP
jgi:MFS family permease